jgi:7-cyano-7-deazaguanine reductase
MELTALGRKVTEFERLETFPRPLYTTQVTLTSDEITAVCPVTGQPDFYTVTVDYRPDKLCVESKTVKLYFQRLRAVGKFCESLASEIAADFAAALLTPVTVTMQQKSRGGVTLVATAECDTW